MQFSLWYEVLGSRKNQGEFGGHTANELQESENKEEESEIVVIEQAVFQIKSSVLCYTLVAGN